MSQALSKLEDGHVLQISKSRGEPGWLAERRQAALSAYKSLPVETSPLYTKYTDARRMDMDSVSLPAESEPGVPGFMSRRLSELEGTTHIVQVGTRVERVSLSDSAKAQKIEVCSLQEALASRPGQVRAALESADHAEDKFTALNSAAFNSGVFVGVPRGAELDGPVHIVSCLPGDGTSVVSRNIVDAGESSRSSLVHELYSPQSGSQQAYLELLTVSAAAGARIDGTTLQMMDPSSVNFSTRRSDLLQDAQVNWYTGMFGTQLSRYRTGYHLRGPGASANDAEVSFGSGEQSFDLQTTMNHESGHTEGRVIQKSILRGRSKSLFKGMIRILEGAAKSNSYLSGRSILLDKDAKSEAIPGLEIFTNDVKATHSASVAQIDEEQIFYLGTRCLSKSEAERTIVEGFLEPLSRKMSTQVRAWIAYLIESKWEGRDLSINTDEELRRFTEVEETRYNENAEIEQHYKYR